MMPARMPPDSPRAGNRPIDEGSETALVSAARTGDVAAFERLYHGYAPRVTLLCLRLMGGDRSSADELVQDTFIRAWRALPAFRGECALSSWLHRLAVSAMLERARGDRRRLARVLVLERPDVGTASRGDRPDERMDLESAIAQLPDGARVVFVLHEIEGFTHEEIAARLGITVGTTKTQLHRARRALMRSLDR